MKQNDIINLYTDNKEILGEYMNGNHRTILYADGTKVKEIGYYINEMNTDGNRINRWVDVDTGVMTYDFPESFDIKITDKCNAGCKYCHEGSSINGKNGDLRGIEPVIRSLYPGTEISIGGGNIFEHPDLTWFLKLVKNQGAVASITVNQKHLRQYKNELLNLVAEKLVYGIGISLVDSSNKEDMELIDMLGDNVVIHVIAGIFNKEDIPFIRNRKLLILGYKDLRRGHDLLAKDAETINKNIEWLKEVLPFLVFETKTISFDCLGIKQINPRDIIGVSDEEWNMLYQGSDYFVSNGNGNITCATMYIDVPNMQVGRSSTAPLHLRPTFTGREDIRELFKLSIKGWPTNGLPII